MKAKINIQIIENYLKQHNLTKTKFCKICNISLSTFNRLMNNNTKVSAKAIYNISVATKISADVIINIKTAK